MNANRVGGLLLREREGGGGVGRSGSNKSATAAAAAALESICGAGLATVTRAELEKCGKDVRGVLKDLPLAEAADIEKLRAATESFNGMLLRASIATAPKHDRVQVAELWQAVAEAFAACVNVTQSRHSGPVPLNTAATCAQALLGAARSLDAINRAEEAESLLAKAHPASLQIEEHLMMMREQTAAAGGDGGGGGGGHSNMDEGRYRALIFDLYTHRSRVAEKLGLFALCGNNLAHAVSAASTMLCNDQKVGVDASLTLSEEVLELARNATKKHKDHARALQLYETALEAASNSLITSEDSRLNMCLHRIYVGLVGTHLELGRHADAARCWIHLESTAALAGDAKQSTRVAVHYLGVRVKLATHDFQAAREEAEKLVRDDHASMDHCCNAVRFLVESGRTGDATDVLWAACARFPEFGLGPLVDLIRLFLTKGESFNEDAAIAIAADARLSVLSESDGGVHGPEAKELRQDVYSLLWNHGCTLFDAKEWERTTSFFAAALSFAPLLDKAQVTRALALAHLGNQDTSAAKEYALLAEELDPSSVRTAMLVFQLQLQSGAHVDDIAEQLEKMVVCDDFDADVLNIASSEALKVGRTDSAEKALFLLFTSITSVTSPKSAMPTPGKEANLIRNAIMLAVDRNDAERCATYVAAAAQRFELVGFEQFFGAHVDAPQSSAAEAENEALWLAGRAFVAGRDHVSHCRWRLAETCLRGSCRFYRSLLAEDRRATVSDAGIDKARAGAVSSAILFALAAFTVHDIGTGDDDAITREVSDVLGMASSLNANMSPATDTEVWKTRTRFIKMLSIEALARVQDTAELMRVVRGCRADKVFSGADFHAVGHRLMSSKALLPMTEIAYEALGVAVQLLDAEHESRLFLSAFRSLIVAAEAMSRDSLRSYSDVAGNLEGKQLPEEAQDECYWLASSCWNKGRDLAKNDNRALALEWLKVALRIAKHSPDIAGDVPAMTASLKLLEDNVVVAVPAA